MKLLDLLFYVVIIIKKYTYAAETSLRLGDTKSIVYMNVKLKNGMKLLFYQEKINNYLNMYI